MVYVNEKGYLERKTGSRLGKSGAGVATKRNWWLVKQHSTGNKGILTFKYVGFPAEYIGKRVRFKVEVIEDE